MRIARAHLIDEMSEMAARCESQSLFQCPCLAGYSAPITKLLEKALQAVRRLPADSQDEIARAMLNMVDEGEPEDIDPAHLADVLVGLAQAKRHEFASDAEVEAAFRRFDR